MLKYINDYFWAFLLLGMVLGIFWEGASSLTPYLTYLLILIFFTSCLKINFRELAEKSKDFKVAAYYAALIMIVTPVLFYFLFKPFLTFEYALAILIIVSMPAGMQNVVYASIFRMEKSFPLLLTIITSLIAPITVPLLIHFLTGIQTNLNVFELFRYLALIIFVPMIIAFIVQRFAKTFIVKTEKFYTPLAILLLTVIIMSAIAKSGLREIILSGNFSAILYPFLLLFVLTFLLYLLGYALSHDKSQSVRLLSALSVAQMNTTLAVTFATQFFEPRTVLLVALYFIPNNLAIIIFGAIARKYTK